MTNILVQNMKLFILHLFLWVLINADGTTSLYLNSSDVRGDVTHFWRSTGFCPPLPHQDAGNFDLSPDMQLNLAYIGALPKNGITQVRVHWLLDLVKVKSMTSQGPEYDFGQLDAFVALLHENELNIGFELMGNPSDIYTDMENRTQVYWWKDLVTETAHRYVARYGIDYVSKWNFETWNEPDCHDFDKLDMSIQGFLNYYDACSEGLKAVDKSLIFGGPGDGCRLFSGDPQASSYADALLEHTIRGTNYFTGEKGVRIDFISFHEKGNANAIDILNKEKLNAEYLKLHYPEIADKPYYNDEADPKSGWSTPEEWRANAWYAGLVAKGVVMHQNIMKGMPDPVIKDYALLSNDNGFLSWYPNQFTQRTLLARFQMNNTEPNYVTFVRKPVYSIMTMLSLLGDKQLRLEGDARTHQALANDSTFGALATLHEPLQGTNTSDSWQTALVIYYVTAPANPTSYTILDLDWIIDPTPDIKSLKMMTYVIYNGGSNPYDVWVGLFNKTDFPTLKQFAWMRQEADMIGNMYDVPVKKGQVPIPPNFQLLDPHTVFMHLCAEPPVPPEKVTDVRFINVTTGQVMVVWSDRNIHTRCILTYEVELSTTGASGPFTKVTPHNTIITLFLYETDAEDKVRGYYRVRAVDYWNRGGEYSDPLLYSE